MLNKFIINSQWILSIIFIIYDYYCTLYQMSYLKLSLLILKCFKVKSEIHKFSALSTLKIRSDQISRSVVSDSLRPHESQHARMPPVSAAINKAETRKRRVACSQSYGGPHPGSMLPHSSVYCTVRLALFFSPHDSWSQGHLAKPTREGEGSQFQKMDG